MEDKYYLFSMDQDGDMSINEVTDINSFLEDLTEKDKFISNLHGHNDPMYWDNALLLIKGKIVVPKPKEKVVKYEVD